MAQRKMRVRDVTVCEGGEGHHREGVQDGHHGTSEHRENPESATNSQAV